MENTVVTKVPSISQKRTMRVAAYCRVSSDSSEQLHSFSAQVQHYIRFISANERMELVDIYADEGITGTKVANRDDFNRLVADCQKGKIDRVLTKSISRFARNTADALKYARLLKEYGVSILFEKENIDTEYMSSELLLALSGAQAQEESISISQHLRWSIRWRMENGTYLSSSTPYGYKLKDGEFCIVEDEAKIVQLIFRSFLSGMGKKTIADMLNEMDAPKRFGYNIWRINTIDYILTNERYIGDSLFQKKLTSEMPPFVRKKNKGEKAQYYVEGTNLPIISKEDFEAVQKLMKKSGKERGKNLQRPLTQKIRCKCGTAYTPLSTGDKIYWGCNLHNFDSQKCDAPRILEKDIYDAFITAVNKLRNCRADILPAAISQTERLQMIAGGAAAKIRGIDKEVAELSNKNLVLARLNAKGILRPAEYMEQINTINSQINSLRTERRKLLKEQDENNVLSGLRMLNVILTGMKEPMTEFDVELFRNMVEEITIPTDTSVCFKLIGDLPVTETIPDRRRCKRK